MSGMETKGAREVLASGRREGSDRAQEAKTPSDAGRGTADTAVPRALKDTMPYSPEALAPILREICASSDAHRATAEQLNLTPQLKGETFERAVGKALEAFGSVEKLRVEVDAGSHTADFRLRLSRPLQAGRLRFEPGDVLIVEAKAGSRDTLRSKLRTPDSHARAQLRETVAREQADGAICVLPREAQNDRMFMERVKASMADSDGESRTTLLMAGPYEGAIRSALGLLGPRPPLT